MRIGHGYDAHRTTPDKVLVLGGVKIPSPFGLLAHSDGDVLLHAIIDALFGAAGERDIGFHFPDTDEKYRGADSMELLRETVRSITSLGFAIDYIDATLIAQAPKLNPYLPAMREAIADGCGIPAARVNVKVTTEEKMGFTGSGEGIAAHAVCLLTE